MAERDRAPGRVPAVETVSAPVVLPQAAADFAGRLGYRFKDPALLLRAITHPSASAKKRRGAVHYERLEFLGDRVLGLVMARWLYDSFPAATEGDLSRRHAALVNRERLATVAQTLALGDALQFGTKNARNAPRDNLTVLADALEAVIAALYIDGGLIAAEEFIHRNWQAYVQVSLEAPRDAKTALQEWAQGRGFPIPLYEVVNRTGPAHAPEFEVRVTVKGAPPVSAKGSSKQLAEKRAATQLLSALETGREKA